VACCHCNNCRTLPPPSPIRYDKFRRINSTNGENKYESTNKTVKLPIKRIIKWPPNVTFPEKYEFVFPSGVLFCYTDAMWLAIGDGQLQRQLFRYKHLDKTREHAHTHARAQDDREKSPGVQDLRCLNKEFKQFLTTRSAVFKHIEN